MAQPPAPAYKLHEVILLESSFSRELNINFEDPDFTTNLNIGIEDQVKDNLIYIIVELLFSVGKNKEVNSKIKMLGVFEFSENTPLTSEEFAKKNGPAIIFPFLREHLATLSMKAGIAPILLPPINFVKMAEETKKQKGKKIAKQKQL